MKFLLNVSFCNDESRYFPIFAEIKQGTLSGSETVLAKEKS